MTPRSCVWTLFLGSAICFVVQIVQEVGRLPDEPVQVFWGALAVKCALLACLNLDHEQNGQADSGAPPPRAPSPRPEEPRHAPTSASTAHQHGARFHRSPVVP